MVNSDISGSKPIGYITRESVSCAALPPEVSVLNFENESQAKTLT
jgi:hypothetical protein